MPGQSGNPSGRPKRSDVETAALTQIYELAPMAVQTLREVMSDEKAPANVRFRCAELVIERVCGKAMTVTAMRDEEESVRFDLGQLWQMAVE